MLGQRLAGIRLTSAHYFQNDSVWLLGHDREVTHSKAYLLVAALWSRGWWLGEIETSALDPHGDLTTRPESENGNRDFKTYFSPETFPFHPDFLQIQMEPDFSNA